MCVTSDGLEGCKRVGDDPVVSLDGDADACCVADAFDGQAPGCDVVALALCVDEALGRAGDAEVGACAGVPCGWDFTSRETGR